MNFTNKIAYCKINFPEVGEENFLKDINLPFIYEPVLDETLNTCRIKLSDLRRGIIPPWTSARLLSPIPSSE